jgi:hypothetical protein
VLLHCPKISIGRGEEGVYALSFSIDSNLSRALDYSFNNSTPPTYCPSVTNLPLDIPLYPYLFSLDVNFEIFFSLNM